MLAANGPALCEVAGFGTGHSRREETKLWKILFRRENHSNFAKRVLLLVAILPAKQILLEENSKFSHAKFSSQILGIDKAANKDHLPEKFDI